MPARTRVALISTYYAPVIGGAEAGASRLATYLHRRGHDVRVITKRTNLQHPERETMDGVAVWRRPPVGPRTAIGKWLWLPWAVGALSATRSEYDVIAVVDQRASGLAALVARWRFGVPVVFQPQVQGTLDGRHPQKHGLTSTVHRWASWPLRWLYGQADAIACIAQSIVREGRTLGVPDSRLHYVPNPVDTQVFRPLDESARAEARASFGLRADEIVFTYVGRLSREKGIRNLLLAWRKAGLTGCRLMVVGPDMKDHPWDEGPWARGYVEAEGMTGSVTFLGPLPHTTIARLQAAADVAVLPSHFEAHPVAAVEAMAAGRPIIASNVGGVPDFVVHDHNGLLVPAHDEAALVAALRRMATDTHARTHWSSAARQTGEQFGEQIVLERFAELIDSLALKRRARCT